MAHTVKPPTHVCWCILLFTEDGDTTSATGLTQEEARESASSLQTLHPKSYAFESLPYLAGVAIDPVVGPLWETTPPPWAIEAMPDVVWQKYARATGRVAEETLLDGTVAVRGKT